MNQSKDPVRKLKLDSGRMMELLVTSELMLPKWVMLGIWSKLPADAELVSFGYDVQRGANSMIIYSAEFPETHIARQLPLLTAKITTEHEVDLFYTDYKGESQPATWQSAEGTQYEFFKGIRAFQKETEGVGQEVRPVFEFHVSKNIPSGEIHIVREDGTTQPIIINIGN